jgi:hypothetical protein
MSSTMRALKAHVKAGRLVLDEPTDLPEGEIEVFVPDAEEFTPEERARLDAALDEGIAAARRGDHSDADEFIQGLLARP